MQKGDIAVGVSCCNIQKCFNKGQKTFQYLYEVFGICGNKVI